MMAALIVVLVVVAWLLIMWMLHGERSNRR